MSRVRAASIHFGISFILGSLLFLWMWFVWYPAPLFLAVGGLQLFAVLLVVDVAIGPLLTLLVYAEEKKSLKFDLVAIAFLQGAAMAYGVVTLYAGRPVYIAALGFRFDLVQAHQVSDSDLSAAGESLPKFGPKWVGIREATDRKAREQILFSALSGVDYGHMPQYHTELESMSETMRQQASPISTLRARNPANSAAITRWLNERGYDDSTAVFQGLKARSQDMSVILDANTGKVVGIAPFSPWQ